MKQKFAWKWLEIHRPDVAEAIIAEVDKEYPLPKKQTRAKRIVPTYLLEMK